MSESVVLPEDGFRSWLGRIVAARWFEISIIVLIIINAIILGLETDSAMAAKYGDLFKTIDGFILSIFVAELSAKFFVQGFRFWRNPWNVFDFFVVGVALIPATGFLSVLRSLRILRVLRLISAVPSMRRVVAGLLQAIPGMGSIVALLLLVLYVSSVMATQLFGGEFPKLFGTLGATVFTLVQIMTLEGWADLAGPVMEKFPYSWIFFLIYILVTSFAVLNLFIGIIVDAMQSEALTPMEEREEITIEHQTDELIAEMSKLSNEIKQLKKSLKS